MSNEQKRPGTLTEVVIGAAVPGAIALATTGNVDAALVAASTGALRPMLGCVAKLYTEWTTTRHETFWARGRLLRSTRHSLGGGHGRRTPETGERSQIP